MKNKNIFSTMAAKTIKYFGIKLNKLKDPDDEIPQPLLKVTNKT